MIYDYYHLVGQNLSKILTSLVLSSISRFHDRPYSKLLSQNMIVDVHREARCEDPICRDRWLRRQDPLLTSKVDAITGNSAGVRVPS
jgi:hypothetical protein